MSRIKPGVSHCRSSNLNQMQQFIWSYKTTTVKRRSHLKQPGQNQRSFLRRGPKNSLSSVFCFFLSLQHKINFRQIQRWKLHEKKHQLEFCVGAGVVKEALNLCFSIKKILVTLHRLSENRLNRDIVATGFIASLLQQFDAEDGASFPATRAFRLHWDVPSRCCGDILT